MKNILLYGTLILTSGCATIPDFSEMSAYDAGVWIENKRNEQIRESEAKRAKEARDEARMAAMLPALLMMSNQQNQQQQYQQPRRQFVPVPTSRDNIQRVCFVGQVGC